MEERTSGGNCRQGDHDESVCESARISLACLYDAYALDEAHVAVDDGERRCRVLDAIAQLLQLERLFYLKGRAGKGAASVE
eukprot:5194513-Pleurochrysis_carterae.AAC.1